MDILATDLPRAESALHQQQADTHAHNHCMQCGACCASFRVSFYWGESDATVATPVPASLTHKINDRYICMQGTESRQPRCIALSGEIGEAVKCSIYDNRPSPCRSFNIHDADGNQNEACNRARAGFGLPAIEVP